MLGIWGDPAVTGKPVGQDLRRKKKTLPVLALRQAADGRGRSRMSECLSAAEPSARQIETATGLHPAQKEVDQVGDPLGNRPRTVAPEKLDFFQGQHAFFDEE